jgi:predicted nucleic acid-binding protein
VAISPPTRIAWDSTVCIDFFQKTPGRYEYIRPIVEDAMAEPPQVIIVISVMAIAETLGSESSTPDDHRTIIRSFFDSKFVYPQSCDRGIAELAQDLRRKHPLNPADAIHLATAVHTQCSVLLTNDGDGRRTKRRLIPLDGLIQCGGAKLRIMSPQAYQDMQFELHNPLHKLMNADGSDCKSNPISTDEPESAPPSDS